MGRRPLFHTNHSHRGVDGSNLVITCCRPVSGLSGLAKMYCSCIKLQLSWNWGNL